MPDPISLHTSVAGPTKPTKKAISSTQRSPKSSNEAVPNLVILHGLFGDQNNWRTQAERLSENFNVYCMDLRNHGASPHAAGMTYPQLAADVAFTCAELGIRKTNVLGHSMGGKTAMQLALSNPDLVDRLVVVDIGPRQYPPHHNKIIEGMKKLATTKLTSRREADTLMQDYVSDVGTRSFLLKNLVRTPDNLYTLRIHLDNIAQAYDDIAAAIESDTAFSNPTLFIKGAKSDYLSDKDRQPIGRLFSDPSLKTVDGAGHWPHSEKPDVIYKIISDFLAA